MFIFFSLPGKLNYGLIIGLSVALSLAIILMLLIFLIVIGSRMYRRKEEKSLPTFSPRPTLLTESDIDSSGESLEMGEVANGGPFENFSYLEGTIDEIEEDAQARAIARTIQNMGDDMVII